MRYVLMSVYNNRCSKSPEDAFQYRIDPAYASGVSHRESGGLSPRQVIRLIQSIHQPIVAADIVEYNPQRDISNLTATVASKLVKEIAAMMLTNY